MSLLTHLNHFVINKHLILIGPHNSRSAHSMSRNVIFPLFALSTFHYHVYVYYCCNRLSESDTDTDTDISLF